MNNEQRLDFLKNKAEQLLVKNFKKEPVGPRRVDCSVVENNTLLYFTAKLDGETHAVFATYSKQFDTLQVSYVRPSVCANADPTMLVSRMNKSVLSATQKTFSSAFGKPTVSYDGNTDRVGFMLATTFEWAEKGKERETIKAIRAGKGLEPYYKIFNIQELMESDSEDEKV